MKHPHSRFLPLIATALMIVLEFAAFGCKDYRSFWVNVTVINRSGTPLREIEVDYPSASFGINQLAAGGIFHYRLKVNGVGKIHAQYPGPLDKIIRVDGPVLQDKDQGQIQIALEPGGKIDFTEDITLQH